jgi:hypothetical protein
VRVRDAGGVWAREYDEESMTGQRACPDCVAQRLDTLLHLVEPECQLTSRPLDGRAFLPTRWFNDYAFGLVRRGVLIRQRVSSSGEAVAIDAAGPGCLVPLADAQPGVTGYAATDLLVCLATEKSGDASDPRTASDLVALQRAAMDRIERLADARGRARAEHRVAALLRALCDTLSPPHTRTRLPSGLQQRDLALLLGMRHETLCRVLGRMERDGLVARTPDGIVVDDRVR